MMTRYEKAKDYVYEQFSGIYNPAFQQAAFCHTNSVDNMITLLAIARGLDVELCKIAAIFHDYAKYADNCPYTEHARLSSLHAHKFLCSMKDISISDIDEICYAIDRHSDKKKADSPFCEALKDADVMARFVEDPLQEFSKDKRERLLKGFADLEPYD